MNLNLIMNITLTAFITVALNPEWSNNPILWWGSMFLVLCSHGTRYAFSTSFSLTTYKIWFLSFISFCFFSMLFAIDVVNSFSILKTICVLMTVIFIMDERIRKREDLENHIQLYMIATFIMMVYVIMNVDLNKFHLSQIGMADTGLWNGNDVGLKCGIFLILFLYFFDKYTSKKNRFILSIAAVLALILLYYTASRKAIIIALFGCFLFFYCKYPNNRFQNLLFICAGICGVLYCFMNVPLLYESIGWRLEGLLAYVTGQGEVDSSTLLRAQYIKVGLDAFVDSPFIGYGINNYRFINMNETGHLTYSHNNFVELLVGIGSVGFILYYYFYVKLAYEFIRLYIRKKTSMLLNTIAICFFSYFIMHVALVSYYDIVQNTIILFMAKALLIDKHIIGTRRREINEYHG